jgi:hypothetical protein
VRRLLAASGVILAGITMISVSPIGTSTAAALVAEPLPSSPQAFGSDFNCDGVSDLAVAGFDYPSRSDLPIGVLNVIYGSTRGLTAARNQSWRQLEFSGGAAAPHLIASLATGDFDGDGCADLAIGISPADPELGSQHGHVSAWSLSVLRFAVGSTLPAGVARKRSF